MLFKINEIKTFRCKLWRFHGTGGTGAPRRPHWPDKPHAYTRIHTHLFYRQFSIRTRLSRLPQIFIPTKPQKYNYHSMAAKFANTVKIHQRSQNSVAQKTRSMITVHGESEMCQTYQKVVTATCLRCDWTYQDDFITNLRPSLKVKEF